MNHKQRMNENGRQINTRGLYLVHGTGKPGMNSRRPSVVTRQTEDEIFFRWRYRGQRELYIGSKLGVAREQVEEVIYKKVCEQDPNKPALRLVA